MNCETALWMGDIESWMDESFIIDCFTKCGYKPKKVKLITDKRTNKFRNFCFVTFSNLAEANEALFNLNAKKIPNTNMFFKLNLTKNNNTKINKNAYVGNLPRKMIDIELFNLFKSKYPSVHYASIITDNGISRGYGFVHFSDENEYQKCLNEMDGIIINNKKINVKEKKMTNDKMNNKYNNINYLAYINNYYTNFYSEQKKEEDFSALDFDDTNSSSQDKEKDSLSITSNNFQSNNFADDIDMLESDDNEVLYAKIQDNIDKMIDYYKNNNNIQAISKIASYYSSH